MGRVRLSRSNKVEGGGDEKKKENNCLPLFRPQLLHSLFTSRGIPREAASKHWRPGPSAALSHTGAPATSTAAGMKCFWFCFRRGEAAANSSAPKKRGLAAVVVVAFSEYDDDDEVEEETAAAACLASGGNRQLASGSIGNEEEKREERERI